MFVADWMTKQVVTVVPEDSVSHAMHLMLERGVKHLPVVEGGVLVGIISDLDFFRALVDITGVRHGGHRICVTVADIPGTIREITDIVRRHGFHLRGILSSYEGVPKGSRRVVIRTSTEGDFPALRADLEAGCTAVRINQDLSPTPFM